MWGDIVVLWQVVCDVKEVLKGGEEVVGWQEKAPMGFTLTFRDVKNGGHEREICQVCTCEEEKTVWCNALSELRLLAQVRECGMASGCQARVAYAYARVALGLYSSRKDEAG